MFEWCAYLFKIRDWWLCSQPVLWMSRDSLVRPLGLRNQTLPPLCSLYRRFLAGPRTTNRTPLLLKHFTTAEFQPDTYHVQLGQRLSSAWRTWWPTREAPCCSPDWFISFRRWSARFCWRIICVRRAATLSNSFLIALARTLAARDSSRAASPMSTSTFCRQRVSGVRVSLAWRRRRFCHVAQLRRRVQPSRALLCSGRSLGSAVCAWSSYLTGTLKWLPRCRLHVSAGDPGTSGRFSGVLDLHRDLPTELSAASSK